MNQPPSLLNMLLSKHTRRREFMALVGAAGTLALPSVARTQPAMPVIGVLDPRSSDDFGYVQRAFRQGLKDAGFVEGERVDRIPVRRQSARSIAGARSRSGSP